MNVTSPAASRPALRIGAAVAGGLVILLAIVAAVRPEMMGMAMLRNLFVGFGL